MAKRIIQLLALFISISVLFCTSVDFDSLPSTPSDGADTVKPVITITGGTTETITVGDSWSNPAATATDETDGTIDPSNISTSGTVDANTAGEYKITYTVKDAANNTGTAVLTVTVKEAGEVVDNTNPVITITGGNTKTITVGDSWSDPTATATDETDGTIDASKITTSGTVDANTAGTYKVTYTVKEAAGNTGTAELTVTVNEKGVVVPGDSLLIEDFEVGEKGQIAPYTDAESNGWWYGYVGGTSTIEPETTDSINIDQKVADSAAYNGSLLGMYAKITLNGTGYPSASIAFSLKASEQYYDLSSLDSITMYMKGSGTINAYLATEFVNLLPEDDRWGHYGKDITLSSTWTKIVIAKDDLKADQYNPLITQTWAESANKVTEMGFEVTGAEVETGATVVEVYLDDIYFHGVSAIE